MKRSCITFTRNNQLESNKTKEFISNVIKDNHVLSIDEEKKLFKKAKRESRKGNLELKNKFLMSNALFFHKVAKHYNSKFPNLSQDDLFNEIYLGAYKAFDTYKSEYNNRFITWASGYMKNFIFDYIRKNNKIVKIPTRIFKNQEIENLPLESYYEHNIYKNVEFNDVYKTNNFEKNVVNDELKKVVEKELNKLTDKERKVLKMYFGINSAKFNKTTICNNLHLSQKEIGDLIKSSLNKLKPKLKEFKD